MNDLLQENGSNLLQENGNYILLEQQSGTTVTPGSSVYDPLLPNVFIFTPSIDVVISQTDAQIYEQGITYDNAGITYDNVGIAYGGVYDTNQDIVPLVSIAKSITPTLTGGTTQAQVAEQGYTYDNAGITYDQALVMYGGLYKTNQDVVPLVSLAETIYPTIYGYSDVYTPVTPPSKGNEMLIGPGFPYQYITYP